MLNPSNDQGVITRCADVIFVAYNGNKDVAAVRLRLIQHKGKLLLEEIYRDTYGY